MSFLVWLEESGLAEWVRSSVAGYPIMISSHAVGMAVMVGIALMLDLRLLGAFRDMRLSAVQPFLTVAWIGFGINFLSGAGLFAAQATSYITDFVFLLKIGLVAAGAATAATLQAVIGRDSAAWTGAPPLSVRALAAVSILLWTGAIVTGRLVAYL